jgi:hypothetical protein
MPLPLHLKDELPDVRQRVEGSGALVLEPLVQHFVKVDVGK